MLYNNVLFIDKSEFINQFDLQTHRFSYDNVFVLTDRNTRACYNRISDADLFRGAKVLEIVPGDVNKSLETLATVWTFLSENKATRRSLLVNVGGGMVTDLGGFAASTFKRGIDYINVPTSLLAMVDASAGGKTAINYNGLKNEIGLFAPPKMTVVSDLFLDTLPEEEFYSGYAEMLKHALLEDWEMLEELLAEEDPFTQRRNFLDKIKRSVEVKLYVVENDPKEAGLRKILNFGHTIGHAFEELAMLKGKAIPHGYAVAWGTVCELYISVALMNFPTEALRSVANYVKEHYGVMDFDCKDYDRLYELMLHDKKNSEKGVNFTLLSDVGIAVVDNYVERNLIEESLDFLRDGI